jgi:hypothetical protein
MGEQESSQINIRETEYGCKLMDFLLPKQKGLLET